MRKLYSWLLVLICLLAISKVEAQTTFLNAGFESGIPSSWSNSAVRGSATWATTTSYFHEGKQSLYLGSGTNRVARLVTPILDVLDAEEPLKLSFYYRLPVVSNANDSLVVLYRTSPSSTWNEIGTINNGTSTFVLQEYSLPNATSTYQVAFVAYSSDKGGVYIDDVKIEDTPLCSQPSNIYLSDGTQNSATINWIFKPNSGSLSNTYQLKVSTSSISDLRNVQGDVFDGTFTTSATSRQISGLSANTTYFVYLRTDCSSLYKGYSTWSTYTFKTPCNPSALPLFENFDNTTTGSMPNCWFKSEDATNEIGVVTTQKYGTTGKSLRIKSTVGEYVVLPATTQVGSDLELSFRMQAAAETGLEVLLTSDPYDISSAVSIGSIVSKAAGNWAEYVIYTDRSGISESNQYFVLYLPSGTSATTVYIDNVEVKEMPACPRPYDLLVSNIKDTNVTLSWSEWGTATSWVVEYSTAGDTLTATATTNNQFVLQGLRGNTEYSIRVKANCGGEFNVAPIKILTRCEQIAIPFVENFNVTSGIPSCWENADGTTTTLSYRWNGTTSGFAGRGIRFNSTDNPSGNKSVLKTPRFNLASVGSPATLKFKYFNNTGGDLSVFISTDGGETYTTPIATGLTSSDYWVDAEYSLAAYASQTNVLIAFVGTSNATSDAYIYLDDVAVEATATCLKPQSVVFNDLTSSSIKVNWTPKGSETAWSLTYVIGKDTTTVNVTGTPSYTIGGLTQDRSYSVSVWVTATCSTSSHSVALVAMNHNFVTPCVPAPTPYKENFDSYSNGGFPDCWKILWCQNTGATYLPQVYNSNAVSAPNSFRLYYKSVVALPEFDEPLNGLRLKFKVKSSSESYKLDVGVMSDLSDTSTFVPIQSITSLNNTTTGIRVSIPFDTYVGSGKYIAFRNTHPTYNYAYFYIDDVSVDAIPPCQDVDEDLWSLETLSPNSIKVNVDDTSVTDWDVQYGLSGFAIGSGTTVSVTGSTSVSIPNLNSSTAYSFYVRNRCGNGQYGSWSEVKIANTFQIPTSLPYTCNFEVPNSGWSLENGSSVNKWIEGSAVASSGIRSLYVSSDAGVTHGYNLSSTASIWAYRTINITQPGSYVVSFDWLANGESTTYDWDYLRAFIVPESVALKGDNAFGILSGTSASSTPAGWTPVDSGRTLKMSGQWSRMTNEFYIAEAGNYNLAFYWRNDGTSGEQPPAAVDNISIEQSTCAKPILNNVTGVGETTASVSWISTGSSSYRFMLLDKALSISQLDTASFNVIMDSILTTNSIDFNTLDQNTYYYFYVRSICQDGVSTWSSRGVFKTECIAFDLPYVETFEDATSQFDCWYLLKGNVSLSTSIKYTGAKSAYISGGVTAVSPKLNTTNLGNNQISGMAYATTDSARIIVGVMLDPNDISTYEPIGYAFIPKKNTWTEFTLYFTPLINDPDYAAVTGAKYVVADISSDYSVYLDDVAIEEIPSCPKPSQLYTQNTTSTSAKIGWMPNNETSWHVKIDRSGVIIMDSIVTNYPITVNNLLSNTEYKYSVRAICSVSDTSAWSNSIFKTACGYLTIPYTDGFENYTTSTTSSTGVTPDCWTVAWTMATADYNRPQIYYYPNYASTGSYSYMMYYQSIVALPEVKDSINTLRIKLSMKTTSSSYKLTVGIMDNLQDTTTFVPIATIDGLSSSATAQKVNVPFNTYTGNGKYIALRNHGPYAYAYVYVDDIEVSKIPACADINEQKWTGISLSASSIQFVHSDTTLINYDVEYGVSGFNLGAGAQLLAQSGDTLLLDGLTNSTLYDVYIRRNCGNGSVGYWAKLQSISTAQFPAVLPFYASFENGTDGFSFENGTNGWFVGSAASHNSTRGLYISNDGGVSNLYSNGSLSYSYAYRLLSLEVEKSYIFQYDWKSWGNDAGWDLARAFLVPENVVLKAGDAFGMTGSSNTNPTGWIDLGGLLQNSADWSSKSIVVNNIPSTGNYHLVFFWKNDGSIGTDPPAAIDNVTVSEITCLPATATVSDVTSSSATVTVAHVNTVPSFKVVIANSPASNGLFAAGTIVKDTVLVGNNTLSLVGLIPNTIYYAYVKAICAVGDTSLFSSAVSFRTECSPLQLIDLPYADNFDSYSNSTTAETGLVPDCWKVVYVGSTTNSYQPQIYNNSTYASSGNSSFRMYMNSVVRLREIAAPLSDIQIKFNLKGSTSTTLEVGILTNPKDEKTFVPVANFIPKGTAVTQIVQAVARFTDYTGTGKYIALRHTGSYLSTYVDDVVIEELPACANPIDVSIAALTDSSVTLAWSKHRASDTQWELIYKIGAVIDTVIVNNTPNFTIPGLNPGTTYSVDVKVRLLPCSGQYYTETISFKSPCVPMTIANLPYSTDFESYTTATYSTGVMPPCWTNVWSATTTVSNMPQVYGYAYYAPTGTYSFRMYMRAITALPAIDAPLNTLRLKFNFKNSTTDSRLIVGVLSNIMDAASFVPVDTIGGITSNVKGNATVYFDNYTGTGKYIAFKNESEATDYPTFYIDDLVLEQAPTCREPENINISPSYNTALITWEAASGQNEWTLKITNDSTGIITNATVTGNPVYNMSGLPASSSYSFKVEISAVCGVGNVSVPQLKTLVFKTLCEPFMLPFIENFNGSYPPNCWTRYSGLFVGNSTSTSALTEYNGGWASVTTNYGLQTQHPKLNIYGTSARYWLVSPLISVDNSSILSFDLALTDYANGNPIEDMTSQLDDKFMVIISEDEGATWELANATVWNNTGSSHVYNNISTTGESVSISLASYVGKTIKIAFYGESTVSGGDNDLHIDNIEIGCYGGEVEINDAMCAGYDYNANGFNISKTEMNPGLNTFSYLKRAAHSEECDTTVVLKLTIGAESLTAIRDTICAGTSYNTNGFSGLSKQGVYVRTFSSATNCDSTVRLTLKVFQVTGYENKTICEGSSFNFGGNSLTQTGLYVDTLTSILGCDSIVTLNLNVIPNAVTLTKDLCEGASFQLGDTTLTTSGTYARLLKNRLGCDSLVTVNLTIYPSIMYETASICLGQAYNWRDTIITTAGNYLRETMNPAGCKTSFHLAMTVLNLDTVTVADLVCEGVGYNNHGFVNLIISKDTVLYERLANIAGCDSINKIALRVVEPVYVTDSVKVTSDELPYNWNNTSYMIGGKYGPVTLESQVTGCDSIVTLVLTIKSGIDDNFASRPFIVSPNPVLRNFPAMVNYEFTEEERRNLRVEIINSLGQIIRNYNPMVYPVQIEGIDTSGYYLIRITTGIGTKYHGNLIVK